MKKVFSILSVILISLCVLAGCEASNTVKTVAFSNITSAGSEDYTVRIMFIEDERVDNKYYDIQLKADKPMTIKIGKEMEEKKVIQLSDKWNSLTSLLVDEPNTETFTKGSEAITLVYILTAEAKANITFRAVVGGIEENAFGTGYIITSPEECSDEFVLQTK